MNGSAHLLNAAWRTALRDALSSDSSRDLFAWLEKERASPGRVLPQASEVFAAYESVSLRDVRVVILGQDPYPTPGHAHGLAFSYRGEGKLPRSLANIFTEVERDTGIDMSHHRGDLGGWAQQGVFLLNTVLTVQAGEAGSHRGQGWEVITTATVDALACQPQPMVFLLWGRVAQKLGRVVNGRKPILEASHPSPLSIRGFRGCSHFTRVNDMLGKDAIDWSR